MSSLAFTVRVVVHGDRASAFVGALLEELDHLAPSVLRRTSSGTLLRFTAYAPSVDGAHHYVAQRVEMVMSRDVGAEFRIEDVAVASFN